MRSRLSLAGLFFAACAVLLFAAGCERAHEAPIILEVDEPGYRRAKDLVKQGRNQEALSEFDKVLDKRGLNNAPDTHFDMATLYQDHIRDPLAAMYHFRKYIDLRPNERQTTIARQNYEAAKREFARTLPGGPQMETTSAMPGDYADVINRLRTDNERLKSMLLSAQAAAGMGPAGSVPRAQSGSPVAPASTTLDPMMGTIVAQPQQGQMPLQGARTAGTSPVTAAQNFPGNTGAQSAPTTTQVQQSQPRPQLQAQQPQQQPRPPTAAVRKHVVRAGDTLSTISRQYYGGATNAQLEVIVNANRDILQSRSTTLRAGMELKLPVP